MIKKTTTKRSLTSPIPTIPALVVKNLTLIRGGRRLLSNLSFTVPVGVTCAVVGANGSGKSTLLRVVEGFEFPTSGTVTVLGQTLGRCELALLRRRVRLVGAAGVSALDDERLDFPHTMNLLTVTATGTGGTLVFYEELPQTLAQTAKKALASVGLSSRCHILWGHASAGEKMRTLLARARMPIGKESIGTGSLLLLDEPTANLDPAARASAVAALAQPPKATTQLIVTHHVEELPPNTELALLLKSGRPMAFGPAAKVLTSANLSKAFGIPLKVTRHPDGRLTAIPTGKQNAQLPTYNRPRHLSPLS